MQLTRKQEEGLKIAVERYYSGESYTCIAGYAGVGKSTVIKFIVAALNLNPQSVVYCAYTGKACQVLRSKGCSNSMTLHRLLYKSIQKADGSYVHIPLDYIGNYSLIVVDEISMVTAEIWQLLLSHHIHVIACGDPGQLPPIGSSNGVLDHPHIFLDEVMRQAQESEIIRLSMDIRDGKSLKPFKGKEINIVSSEELSDGMMIWADQVICGKNNTRFFLNDHFRRIKWGANYQISPIVGDKLICLKNNFSKSNGQEDVLVNGLTGTLTKLLTKSNPYLEKQATIDFIPTDGIAAFTDILADWKLLTRHEPTVTKENFRTFPKKLRPELFDYGYVITCHKSQGSEWSKVLVIEEKLKSTKENHIRWLYTACTRPRDKLTLVLGD